MLTLDAYERLCEPHIKQTDTNPEALPSEPIQVIEQIEEPTQPTRDTGGDQSEETPLQELLLAHTQLENSTVAEAEKIGDWLDEKIPLNFRARARTILKALSSIPELGITCQGTGEEEVLLSGTKTEFDLKSLILALTVPFTRSRIPQSLQALLVTNKVPIRNHLVLSKPPPEWHVYFRF